MIEDPEPGTYFEAPLSEWSNWQLKHNSLRKPQFVMYACVWTKIVWQDAMMSKGDDEDQSDSNVPRELQKAWCTQISCRGQNALQFEWEERQERELVAGDRFILCRSSVDVDGYFKCVMTVDHKTHSRLVVLGPKRVPHDIEEGLWRLTAMPS